MTSNTKLFFIAALAIILFQNCTKEKDNKLIWSDEFNYSGHPDPDKWGYEKGYVRNKEKQFYTDSRLENVRVENGHLIIETKKDNYNGHKYTSGSINTDGKYSFTGNFRVEVYAKLPSGKGIWPAIWMMGMNRSKIGWPKCSELDIMEFVGHTPKTIYNTMHWYDNTKKGHKSSGKNVKLDDPHNSFHTYALERKGNTIKTFVDTTCVMTFSVPENSYKGSFTSPLYLLLNTALGGSWGGEVDNTILPQKFIIDYVRVYKL